MDIYQPEFAQPKNETKEKKFVYAIRLLTKLNESGTETQSM